MPAPTPNVLRLDTPTDTTLVLTRAFRAPRRLVWEAFFTPARMRRWMLPPPGLTMTDCVCEARVGASIRIAWKNDEADPFMTLEGVFTEVVPHERAVHTETMALGNGVVVGSQVEEHAFTEADGVTTMRITQTYASKAARDEAIGSGMDEGMEACYRQLEALFA